MPGVADAAVLLGLLTHEPNNDMALHCYPQSYCDDGSPADESEGKTHDERAPCPFAGDSFPRTSFDTCCSLYAEHAVDELFALGIADLAERMFKDMAPEEALSFAADLGRRAEALERAYSSNWRGRPRGAGHDGRYDESIGLWVYERYSTLDEALAAMRVAARWYEKVGTLGFGVRAENRTRFWLKEK